MRVQIRKYGDLLVSRPAGREAAAAMVAYLPLVEPYESIDLDFEGVIVVAPSWLDEVLAGLRAAYANQVRCLPSSNPTLIESLKVLGEPIP